MDIDLTNPMDPVEGGYNTGSIPKDATTLANGFSEEGWLNNLKQAADNGSAAARETLWQYYINKESTKTANEQSLKNLDEYYPRIVNSLREAGISPYILSGGAPGNASVAHVSASGSKYTSEQNNIESQASQGGRSLLTLVGTLLMAMAIAA